MSDVAGDTEPEETAVESMRKPEQEFHMGTQPHPFEAETQAKEVLNLFDILNEDVSGSDDDNPIDDAQEDNQE